MTDDELDRWADEGGKVYDDLEEGSYKRTDIPLSLSKKRACPNCGLRGSLRIVNSEVIKETINEYWKCTCGASYLQTWMFLNWKMKR